MILCEVDEEISKPYSCSGMQKIVRRLRKHIRPIQEVHVGRLSPRPHNRTRRGGID